MHEHQTVYEMVEEVLARQARAQAHRSGQPFDDALETVLNTECGRQLRELANGPHGQEQARDWQERLAWERSEERWTRLLMASDAAPHAAEEHNYSWVEAYLERLEGKESREHYYALIEEELLRLKG